MDSPYDKEGNNGYQKCTLWAGSLKGAETEEDEKELG
jgi:hypothetical protein